MNNIYWLIGNRKVGRTRLAAAMSRLRHMHVIDDWDCDFVESVLGDVTDRGEMARYARIIAEIAGHVAEYSDVVIANFLPYDECYSVLYEILDELVPIYLQCGQDIREQRMARVDNMPLACSPDIDEPWDVIIRQVFDTSTNDPDLIARLILGDPEKYQVFIGRWQPLHYGHVDMIKDTLKRGPVAVGIRNTPITESDPYTFDERVTMFKKALPVVKTFLIPDVASVNYGRAVGWTIVEEKERPGSATAIRTGRDKLPPWVAPPRILGTKSN